MKFVIGLFFISFTSLFAQNIQLVPVSIKNINWKEQVGLSNVKVIQVNEKYNCKKYMNIDVEKIKENKYRASHYIMKGKPLCDGDLYLPKSNKIKFNFGSIEIEKEGEIIRETDKYIKIKNLDGKIEKIYKDVRGQ